MDALPPGTGQMPGPVQIRNIPLRTECSSRLLVQILVQREPSRMPHFQANCRIPGNRHTVNYRKARRALTDDISQQRARGSHAGAVIGQAPNRVNS